MRNSARVILCSTGILIAIMALAFMPLRSYLVKRNTGITMMHAHELGFAFVSYTDAHHGRFPASKDWEKAIMPYCRDYPVEEAVNILVLPGEAPKRFAMNAGMSERTISSYKDPVTQPLLFESHSTKSNACGELLSEADIETLVCTGVGTIIVYADGHASDEGCPLHLR